MPKYLLTIIAIFYAQVNAVAMGIHIPKSNCSNLDIRDGMSRQMKNYFSTPLNQSGSGWCYAFVTADLLSAHTKSPISATHVAAIFNQRIESNLYLKMKHKLISLNTNSPYDSIFVGGWVDSALKYVADKKRICLESDLPYDKEYRNQTLRALQRFENMKENIEQIQSPQKACRTIEDIKDQLFLNSNTQDILDILKTQEVNTALESIIDNHCSQIHIKVPKMEISSMPRPKNKRRVNNYFNKIEQTLKSSRPLSVSYNLHHIMDSNINHTSTLTARRWKNGQCQFKIRNTWGKSCLPYDKNKIEECVSNEGSLWISAQRFYEMVNRIDFIK